MRNAIYGPADKKTQSAQMRLEKPILFARADARADNVINQVFLKKPTLSVFSEKPTLSERNPYYLIR